MSMLQKSAFLRLSLQSQQRRFVGSTVRIIAVQDLPNGKAYQGDVLTVKAGYARNFLFPQKMAMYATRQNFLKLDMKDPDLETAVEKRERLEVESASGDDKDLKAADILRYFLRNKVVSTELT
jgi:ribosomal protein L9